MQYGNGWMMSPYQKVNYTPLYDMSNYCRILIAFNFDQFEDRRIDDVINIFLVSLLCKTNV